jgi:hypothetical protein
MLVRQIYLGLFLIFLVASSIYLFPPGMPQPADLLMAFLIAVLATGFIIKPPVHSDVVFVGVLFVGYAALVNLFWFTQYNASGILLTAVYYSYDFAAMMVVASLIRAYRERFVTLCQGAIIGAIVFEILMLFALPPSLFRATGTFNNPNQLGYWGLLMGCCWLVLREGQRLTVTDFLVLCGAGYLTANSLSKAAMVSFVLLLLMALLSQRVTRAANMLFLSAAIIGTPIVLLDSSTIEQLQSVGIVDRVGTRLSDVGGQGDDSLGGRGYDRIWRYSQHLVFGAGEGAVWRFGGQHVKELHSTLGTVLFSYGLIGFFLFFGLLVMVFRRAPLACMLYSLPIWAYGLTHQGLRDTMLWVFLGMVFGMAHYVWAQGPAADSDSTGAERAPPRVGQRPRAASLRRPLGRPKTAPVHVGARGHRQRHS